MARPRVLTECYPLRLSPAQLRALKKRAEKDGRPVCNYIRHLIDTDLAAGDKPGKDAKAANAGD